MVMGRLTFTCASSLRGMTSTQDGESKVSSVCLLLKG